MWAATGGQAEVKTRQDKTKATGGQAEVKTRQDKTRQRLLEDKQRSRGQDQSLAWEMEREKQSRSNVGCYRRPSRGQDKTRQDKGYWRPIRGQEVRTSHWPGRWSMRSNPGAMWAATGGQAEVKTIQDKTRQDKGYWRPSRGQEVRTSHWPGRWSVKSNPGAMWAATGGQAEVKTRQDKTKATGGQAEVKRSGPVTGLEDGA